MVLVKVCLGSLSETSFFLSLPPRYTIGARTDMVRDSVMMRIGGCLAAFFPRKLAFTDERTALGIRAYLRVPFPMDCFEHGYGFP